MISRCFLLRCKKSNITIGEDLRISIVMRVSRPTMEILGNRAESGWCRHYLSPPRPRPSSEAETQGFPGITISFRVINRTFFRKTLPSWLCYGEPLSQKSFPRFLERNAPSLYSSLSLISRTVALNDRIHRIALCHLSSPSVSREAERRSISKEAVQSLRIDSSPQAQIHPETPLAISVFWNSVLLEVLF